MAHKFQTLRGFHDLLPGQTEHWQRFERIAHQTCQRYGFREIRPPALEATALFVRSVGEATDIVGKEMFTFDVSDTSVSLRPEITASVCRAYVQHGLDRAGISRLYYLGSCFRKERPQRGRLRQFHQIGAEIFGESSPSADVELIALALELVTSIGIEDATLKLNTLGDRESRANYRGVLQEYLRGHASELDEQTRARVELNPLRVLDSKSEQHRELIANAPEMHSALTGDARKHFDAVVDGLTRLGHTFEIDQRLVRGLDYYVHTTFEIQSGSLGSQNAVLGGGRYDGLVKELGGRDVPGIGFAAGIERLLIAAGYEDRPAQPAVDAYLVTLGDAAREAALPFVQQLRASGASVMWDTGGHGLGGQMKRAGRSGARFAIVVGDDEIARGQVTVKDMQSGTQTEAPYDARELVERLLSTEQRD